MNKCTERVYNGLIKENPTFVLMLGMCPTLAVTTSERKSYLRSDVSNVSDPGGNDIRY